jgi:hypothetical protein
MTETGRRNPSQETADMTGKETLNSKKRQTEKITLTDPKIFFAMLIRLLA